MSRVDLPCVHIGHAKPPFRFCFFWNSVTYASRPLGLLYTSIVATLECNGANRLIFTSVITLVFIFLFSQILQNHKGNKAKREGRMLKSPKAVTLEFKEVEVLLGSHLSRLGLKTWPHPSAMLMM